MVMVRVAYRATGVVFRQRTRTWPAGSAASSGRVLVATVQAIAVPLAEMSPKATLPPAVLVFRSSVILKSPAAATVSGP